LKGLEKSKNEENRKIQYDVIDKLAQLYIKDKKYLEVVNWLNEASKLVRTYAERESSLLNINLIR
jgi:hypothetical protein